MKVTVLKKQKRFESRNDKSLGIQTYGESNDYPQQVVEVSEASGTGSSCIYIYKKFICGQGFFDKEFYKKVVNKKGQTNDYLLDQICSDYSQFGGFAIHVNYNALYKIVDLQFVPFETVRFEKLDDNGEFGRVALHPDWGRQFLQLRKWKKEDIDFINFFNPDPEIIKKQVEEAGGWENYKGQIFYFSRKGEKTYPTPIFDSTLTDMNTETAISNVSNRNACNNFLTAGALVDYNNGDESQEQENDTEKSLIEFQGDEKACKIIYMQVGSKEETPAFISFKGENYDKEFDSTRKAVKESIGESFNQPPILRSQDVGANFGAELIKNAYDYYNSVTSNERIILERVFTELFKYWFEPIVINCEIEPLNYNVRLNLFQRLEEKGFDQMMKIVESTTILQAKKKEMLKTLFNFTEEELSSLI